MGCEPALQLVGEQQVGQLGLTVGPEPAITPLPLQIVKVDLRPEAVVHAADGDDPGGGRCGQPIQQQPGEREWAQVVDAELELEAVSGRGVRRVAHPGVVDQQIDPVMSGAQLLGSGPDRGQRTHVEMLNSEVGPRIGFADPGCRVLTPLDAAHGEHDRGSTPREHPGGVEADAGVSAGDDSHPAALRRHRLLGPLLLSHDHPL